MKIILLKEVAKLGHRFDVKEISAGHALNFLIPRGLAIVATPEAVKKMEIEKSKYLGDKQVQSELFLKNIESLDGITITFTGKANDKGHLFAGLHKEDIAKEIEKQTRLVVDPAFIILEHPIKEVGEHKVEVVAEGKKAVFTLVVNCKEVKG